MQTNIYALSGIRTHDPSVPASEDIYALDHAATLRCVADYECWDERNMEQKYYGLLQCILVCSNIGFQ
jgi:hypothetical protein